MATWNSRGLRGSTLEEFINRTNEIYQENGLSLIQKIPTPITPDVYKIQLLLLTMILWNVLLNACILERTRQINCFSYETALYSFREHRVSGELLARMQEEACLLYTAHQKRVSPTEASVLLKCT